MLDRSPHIVPNRATPKQRLCHFCCCVQSWKMIFLGRCNPSQAWTAPLPSLVPKMQKSVTLCITKLETSRSSTSVHMVLQRCPSGLHGGFLPPRASMGTRISNMRTMGLDRLLAPMGMQGSTFTGWAFSAYPLPWKAGLTCPRAGTDRPTCDSWDDLAKSTDCALPMKDGAYNIYGVFTCPDFACTGRRTGSMWDTRKDDTRKQLVAYCNPDQ